MKTLKHWLDTYIAYTILIGCIIWLVKGEALKFDDLKQKYDTILSVEQFDKVIGEIKETF